MYEIDREKFGTFVAALRKEKGMTQRELAQQLYISDKAVSKWERGSSIPDTALLIPLAEILDVSVTELLLCERRKKDMDSEQVEDIVKTAIQYPEVSPKRAWQEKGSWGIRYILAFLVGICCAVLGMLLHKPMKMVWFCLLICGIFGAYFCFFARTKLSQYYDENKISGIHDGFLRMNVPGLVFNNRNWKPILRVGRIWSCVMMTAFPLFSLGMYIFLPDFWAGAEQYLYVLVMLGGLFVPIVVTGRKHT